MSETDDTDELLLIPPDLYAVNPELELHDKHFGPYYNVVDSLIDQIGQLEERISLIETSSDVSLADEMQNAHGMDRGSVGNSPSRFRKFHSSEDLAHTGSRGGFSHSAQNTPQKPRNKFTINSLPASPNLDAYRSQQLQNKRSPRRTRKPEVNPMLGEIDSFISNVKFIQRLNAVRNLEKEFDTDDDLAKGTRTDKEINVNEVDDMLKDMELKQRQMEERIREKEEEILSSREKPFVKDKTWQPGENAGSVPDYGYGMKRVMYPDEKIQQSSESQSASKCDSDNSSDTTQMTAFEKLAQKDAKTRDVQLNAVKVLNMHKQLLESSDLDYNLGLVSLSNLWNSNLDSHGISSKYQQKLQEEKLRRQHCEKTIQDLQNRVLELQERVAVAVQVDEAKNKAIIRFHECYEKINAKALSAEKERDKLQEELEKLKRKSAEESEEALRRIAHYESEASKALNLASSAQEKTSALQCRSTELENELQMLQAKLDDLQKKYATELDKNRQYPEIIARKEIELNENKVVLSEARKEVAQCKKAVEVCQSELNSLNAECNSLRTKWHEEKEMGSKLIDQKNKLLEEVNAHKQVERSLQDEVRRAREQIESNKVELKSFYQGQVELVVQNKLKEFQSQLDQAEKMLKEEVNKKEMAIAKNAASHIQQITQKYNLEVTERKLLEERHQEECRRYQLQLTQLQQEFEEANFKLKRQQEKHAHIEQQLFKFMESLRQDSVTTVDDLNSFRSRSFTNLEEILQLSLPLDDRNHGNRGEGPTEGDKNAHSQGTYRVQASQEQETPLSSRSVRDNNKGARRKENSLQETIQMLLSRKPAGDSKNAEENFQGIKEGAGPQRLSKEGRGRMPWK